MKAQKVGKMAIFSVGAVLFSAHAGGGFATGNQANTYYVGLGWTGIVSAIIAMLLLILTMREAMVMYNQRNLTSAKELFENLYHPFDKLEILFEIFFNIMVLMAVAAAISGAASALQQYFGFNYYACVVAVGIVVLCLTIFGARVGNGASEDRGVARFENADRTIRNRSGFRIENTAPDNEAFLGKTGNIQTGQE